MSTILRMIISFALVGVTTISTWLFPTNDTTLRDAIDTVASVEENGYPMMEPGAVIEMSRRIRLMLYSVTGLEKYSPELYNLALDESVQEIADTINECSGVDFSRVYNNLHSLGHYADVLAAVTNIDVEQTQQKLNEKSWQLRDEGKPLQFNIVRLFSAWLGHVTSCTISTEPVDWSDTVVRFTATLVYKDGRTDTLHGPFFYDTETCTFIGENGEPAFLGYSYDADDAISFTGQNTWHSYLGYTMLFDIHCELHPFYFDLDTTRIKFNCGGKEWMIQLWKGRYFITNGGEIGIYNRTFPTGTWYQCATEDQMPMSMKISHGSDVIIDTPEQEQWWAAYFKPGDTGYVPSSLTMDGTITLPDAEMLAAFTKALGKHSDITYSVDGLKVSFTWQ